MASRLLFLEWALTTGKKRPTFALPNIGNESKTEAKAVDNQLITCNPLKINCKIYFQIYLTN
ncbi:hypothetical protein SD10_17870 [Spirosoma radiotolerans]|uniref:Uncharacterized protein n=1 Tax=Spirosoma radiotolerans TaxID=1379870 RepID=A0A0E3ZXN7_9BACT|nr:hypothetical protein SD10_17870 [Spirosoma radiotolerans]